MAEEGPGRRALLGQPMLSTADAVGQGLVVGPIQGAGFLAFLVAGTAGAATPLVLVIATFGALCLGWVVSLYARRYAGTGSIYEYVARGLGPRLGIASAGAYFLGGFVFTVGAAAAAALLWQDFFARHAGFDPGFWPTGLALIAAINLLAYAGVRPAVRIQLVLTALSAIPFAILVIAVIATGGESGNTLAVFNPWNPGAGDVLGGLLFAVLMFAGFEMTGSLGEEARLPHESIPRAILITVILAGAFYVAVVYAATIGFGAGNVAAEWGANPVGLTLLADRYVGPPLGLLIELAVIVDLFAIALAGTNAFTRGVFALARDGFLPRRLATRSRHETPVGGIVVNVFFAVAGLIIATPLADRSEPIRVVGVTFTLIVMLIYLLLVWGVVRRNPEQRPAWHWLALAGAAALPALAIYGTLTPFPSGAAELGIWLCAAVIGIVAAWVLYLVRRRPEAISRAAAYTLSPQDSEASQGATTSGRSPRSRIARRRGLGRAPARSCRRCR
jgi:amino acid transporter